MRASRAVVIVPKLALAFLPFAPGEKLTFGAPRFTWFMKLNDSARN